MKTLLRTTAVAAILAGSGAAFATDTSTNAAAVQGRWDAVLSNNGPDVPFRLDISGEGSSLKGTFYDGFQPYETTTSASFQDGKLVLKAEHYLTTINATVKDGELVGETTLQGSGYILKYGFHAKPHQDTPKVTQVKVPAISGSWVIPLDTPSSKGEKAFRFVVQQHGSEAAASILRIDGDTGAYTGSFQNGKWILSHFDGHRPGVIEISTNADGSLVVVAHNEAFAHALQGSESDAYAVKDPNFGLLHYVAYRPEVEKAKGLPAPDSFTTHTVARDANETFKFKFPDQNGKILSNEDFKGKVVVAIVTGTWCPNCHDEAQYLVQLDKKYRDKGLAIVALDFEEPDQQGTLARERAFVKQYGVKYPYLIAGAPSEMWEKVPQLDHLDSWPTTVFVGRDGKIKATHSGFASPASGEFHAELRKEFEARIEELLAEKANAT